MRNCLQDIVSPPFVKELLLDQSFLLPRDCMNIHHQAQYDLLFRTIQDRCEPYPVRRTAGTTKGMSWGLASILDNLIYGYRKSNVTPYADPLSQELRKLLSKSSLLRMPIVAHCNFEQPFVLSSDPDMQELLEAVTYVDSLLTKGKAVYFKRDDTVKGEGVVQISRTRNFLRARNFQGEEIYKFHSDISYCNALIELLSQCYTFTKPRTDLRMRPSSAACLQVEFESIGLKGLKGRPWEIRLIVDDAGLVIAYGKVGLRGAPIANISQGAEPFTVQQLREFTGRPKAFDEFFQRSVGLSRRVHRDIGSVLDSIATRHLNPAHFGYPMQGRRTIAANFTVVDCAAVWIPQLRALNPRVIEIQRQAGFSQATQRLDLDIESAVSRVEGNLKELIEDLPFSSNQLKKNRSRQVLQ